MDNNNTKLNDPDANTANWFGLYKVEQDRPFSSIIQDYIFYIGATTLYSIILLRQKRNRLVCGSVDNLSDPFVNFCFYI